MTLPTSEELSRLSVADLLGLWMLVQRYKAKLEAVTPAGGPDVGPYGSGMDAMIKAVPDDLMRAVVEDNRRGQSVPGSLAKEPVVRGTGWADPIPEGRSPHQQEMFDRMVEHFVGGPNDTRKLR